MQTKRRNAVAVTSGAPASNRTISRVIIGATVLGLGGIRTHLALLCQLLRRQGIEVVVFATGSNWDQTTIADLKELGVQFNIPPAVIRVSRKLSSLYCGLAWPWLVPKQATSLYCISAGNSQLLLHRLKPSRAFSINHEIVEPPGPQSPAGKCAARLDVTVANSRKVAQSMNVLWPEKPIRVIPFLTSDGPTPAPAGRRQVDPDGLLRVVYLGRLVEQKRPDQLVRSWPALSAKTGLSPARLDVYGYDPDGKMFKSLQAFVADSGLSDRVKIHGEYSLSDLPRILDESDLVVLPSLWEGLPLVLVEAMLKGVPFVACAAGGTEELGENNPDVSVTSTEWGAFEAGLIAIAKKIRAGSINPVRLHNWAEERYGYEVVSEKWLYCVNQPKEFFNLA
jgi:glycosyltransferase involved in cell wall biosynthesis